MNFWNQIRNDLDLREFLSAFKDVAAAHRKLRQELLDVEAFIFWAVIVQVAARAVVELSCAADVAVAKMMEANGDLDQALIEPPRRALRVGPQVLPHFV